MRYVAFFLAISLAMAFTLIIPATECSAQLLLNELIADPASDWDGDGSVGSRADEWVEGDYPLLFHDSRPQQQGSNTTYARRYALWAMLGLAPEDDDGQGSNDSGGNHRNWHQKPPKPAAPSGHHPSFKGHQGKFFARLKELGWGYNDQVAPWCEANGWGRPSGWSTADREQLLQDLANGPKAAELLDWVEGQK